MKSKTTINTAEYYNIFPPLKAYKKFLPENEEVLKNEFNGLDKNKNNVLDGKELDFLAFRYATKLYGNEMEFRKVRFGRGGARRDDTKLELDEKGLSINNVLKSLRKV